ncbi:MAG: DUF2207 family protein [Clostridium sp.]
MIKEAKIETKFIFKILISLLILCLFLSFGNVRAESERSQELKKLDFEVSVNSEGVAHIKEKWNIKIEKTGTLFKTYNKGLENVKVYEVSGSDMIPFRDINKYVEHMNNNEYYYAKNPDGKMEVGWGTGGKNSTYTKKYIIEYDMPNFVTETKEYSQIYFMPIDRTNAIPVKEISLRLKLPKAVEDSKLRVFGHGQLSANVSKENGLYIVAQGTNLEKKKFFEVRGIIERPEKLTNIVETSGQSLKEILEEEENWARAEERKVQMFKVLKIMLLGLTGVFLILSVLKYFKSKKYYEEKRPEKLEYYSDFPDEGNGLSLEDNMTLHFLYSNSLMDPKQQFSAYLLNFKYLKLIDIYVSEENKKKYAIVLKENVEIKDEFKLSDKEKRILNLLNSKSKNISELSEKQDRSMLENRVLLENETKTSQSFSKYIMEDDFTEMIKDNFDEILNYENERIKGRLEEKGYYEKKEEKNRVKVISFMILKILFEIFAIAFVLQVPTKFTLYIPILIVLNIVMVVVDIYAAQNYNALTRAGMEEGEKLKGLKKYMNDFGLMGEKDIPELILWEKYLVYATLFGIATKVLKQFKNIQINQNLDTDEMTTFTNVVLINSVLNDSLTKTYNSIASANYSGGGGSFSSGGGGGFGGGGMGGR